MSISSSTSESSGSSLASDEAINSSSTVNIMVDPLELAPFREPIVIPPIPMTFSQSDPEVNTIVMDYLQVPKLQKMFLISPPASPPLGWEHSIEQAPVIAHRDMHNLKSILDAKTPKEYFETVYGSNQQQQDEMMAQVVAKLSLCIQQSNNRESRTRSKSKCEFLTGNSSNC